jgi:adenylosuccinate synthase
MPAVVVVGVQWGDEGKGKVIDFLSTEADIVVRHQGGNNAGHTVFANGKKHVVHLLPTGIIRNRRSAIGSGVVVDPRVLVKEIEEQRALGISISPENLMVSHPSRKTTRGLCHRNHLTGHRTGLP